MPRFPVCPFKWINILIMNDNDAIMNDDNANSEW